MAAILKNGGHIKILRGPRFFLVLLPPKSICAKSVACIIIWTILTVICSTNVVILVAREALVKKAHKVPSLIWKAR